MRQAVIASKIPYINFITVVTRSYDLSYDQVTTVLENSCSRERVGLSGYFRTYTCNDC